ncbi:retropepsin-like aspartic protease [Pedobacter gandavensis]|uniref:retropepsin-like aspartic protease n=1 Tax=Pedobacter gandavensis TaxID=2679963 RepID=UPI00292D6202|nr:retropepsin-like aspartic protease [Pedobacter gandavensis]
MKRLLLIISLILPSFTVFSQGINYNTGETSTKNYYQEIPYESINGKMIVEVKVAGKNCRFLFDTGAPTSISKELALTSGSKNLQMGLISDANGLKDSVLVVLTKSIQIGDLDFNNITAIALIPEFMKCWNLSGIIGSNLLRNSIVRIDAAKKIITLTDQADRLNLSKKHSTPLALNNNQSDPGIIVDLGRRVSGTRL